MLNEELFLMKVDGGDQPPAGFKRFFVTVGTKEINNYQTVVGFSRGLCGSISPDDPTIDEIQCTSYGWGYVNVFGVWYGAKAEVIYKNKSYIAKNSYFEDPNMTMWPVLNAEIGNTIEIFFKVYS